MKTIMTLGEDCCPCFVSILQVPLVAYRAVLADRQGTIYQDFSGGAQINTDERREPLCQQYS